MSSKNHYIDGKQFTKDVSAYVIDYHHRVKNNLTKPPVPDTIAGDLLLISTNMARKNNFVNYTYIEDMVMDGVEISLRYIHNYDPTRGYSAFSYFSLIIWRAFVNRIKKENKQRKIKESIVRELNLADDELDYLSETQKSDLVSSYYYKEDATKTTKKE